MAKIFSKARLVNLALVLFSLALTLPIVEVAVRLLPPEYTAYTEQYMGDALLGIPTHFQKEIALDFPDGEAKPKDVYRIVVLGDSHAVNVRREKSYAELLDAELNAQDLKGKRVEVMNAGAPGHSHYQYYLVLKERLARFRPDLAIVGYYLGNDFLDLYRNDDRPALRFDGQSWVHEPPSFSQYIDPERSGWINASKVAQLFQLFWQRKIGYTLSRVGAVWSIGEQSGQGVGAASDYLWTITQGSFINEAIWKQSMNQILFLRRFPGEKAVLDRTNLRITEMMEQLAKEQGVRIVYAPNPTKLMIEPDSDPVVLQKTLELCGLDRSALAVEDELEKELLAMLAAHGFETIDLKPGLRERAKSATLYEETYHPTWDTHEVIAHQLAKAVLPMVLGSTSTAATAGRP
jgi:hypothetical protein